VSRGSLFGISLVAHLGLAAGLGRIERPVVRQATAISISETAKKKPEPPKPVDEPPPQEKAPSERANQRAKAAPAKAKAVAEIPQAPSPAKAGGAEALDGLPDFGVALAGGTGGSGLAVPAAKSGGARAALPEKVVKRPQSLVPKQQACDEPPVKPKPKNVPTPVYTETARALGIEGKVRVEVTVDEEGRVVSVRVLQGLGHGLDEAAVEAARRASFEPATRCGKPVGATFNIGMRFSG